MSGDDPGGIRVLLIHSQGGAGQRAGSGVRVGPQRPDADSRSALPHHVRHVNLGRPTTLEAGEVGVFRSRHDSPAGAGDDLYAYAATRLVDVFHTRGAEPSTPQAREHLIAWFHLLDARGGTVGH